MEFPLPPDPSPSPSPYRPGVVAAGGILMALGVAMLLDSTGKIDIRVGQLIGPLVLIALGAAILFDKGGLVYGRRVRGEDGRPRMRLRRRGNPAGGFWLIGIGVWMMVSQMHLFGLSFNNSWPLFIILSGIMMVVRGAR
ncbi:MAG TPA: hypothetical protein VN716_01560 [Vicinamibacterales bacterium]|nr:hypothetical protein [Vicinamibacterales bacterium]